MLIVLLVVHQSIKLVDLDQRFNSYLYLQRICFSCCVYHTHGILNTTKITINFISLEVSKRASDFDLDTLIKTSHEPGMGVY